MRVLNKLLFALSCSVLAQSAYAQQASDGVVKIGILNDQSGVYADFGGKSSVEAARMAVQDFGGKVLGVPVEIVSADHQNKPDVASSIARQWYDTEKVDAIMELTTSSVALAVQGLSKEKKKITIVDRRGDDGPHRQAVLALRLPLGLRHPCAGGRHRRRAGGERRQQVVLPHRRLRLRLFPRGRDLQIREIEGRPGRSAPSAIRWRPTISRPSCSRRRAPARTWSAWPMPASTPPTPSSRRPSSASPRAAPRLAALLFTLAEVQGLGLKAAQGLTLTEGWYWDQSDENRAFAKRFQEKTGRMPNMIHVGTYSAVTQYLKAVQKAGTDATEPVAKLLHEMPVEDVFAKNGKVLPNGRMVYDMYLFQVKKPEESKSEWDMYKQLAKVPGDQAYHVACRQRLPGHAVTRLSEAGWRARRPRLSWPLTRG